MVILCCQILHTRNWQSMRRFQTRSRLHKEVGLIVTSLQYKYNDLLAQFMLWIVLVRIWSWYQSYFFTIDLEQDGFSKNPFFHGIIAEVPEHLKSRDGDVYLSSTILLKHHLKLQSFCVALH